MRFFLPHPAKVATLIHTQPILAHAQEALEESNIHITDARAPLSEGGPHDFYSNGDYWWPNPSTADGLPYVRRDGQSNPEAFLAHRTLLRTLRTRVAALSAAYQLTEQAQYAQKAVSLLKAFFLDKATKMNPHLLYAQAIPGVCSGRGIGLIDTLHLIDVPVAIDLLKSSEAMTEDIYKGLRQWFADYLNWMSTHPYGIDEMNEANNHGVCWHVQAAVFAKFTGNETVLTQCRERYKNSLLPEQMNEQGGFALELARTKPYGYSIFVLDNMVTLCYVLSTPEDNLWEYTSKNGRSIAQGLAFLYPYLDEKTTWPYAQDIEHFEGWPVSMSFMLFAKLGLGEERFAELWSRFQRKTSDEEIRRNTAIRCPYLWVK